MPSKHGRSCRQRRSLVLLSATVASAMALIPAAAAQQPAKPKQLQLPCSGFNNVLRPSVFAQPPFAVGSLNGGPFYVLDTGQAQTTVVCFLSTTQPDGSIALQFTSWFAVSAATQWHIDLTLTGGVGAVGLSVAGSLATVVENVCSATVNGVCLSGSPSLLAGFSNASGTSNSKVLAQPLSPLFLSSDISLSGPGFVDFTMTFTPAVVPLSPTTISVTSVPPGARFRLSGQGATTFSGSTPFDTTVAAGNYTINWEVIRGYNPIPSETKQVLAGKTTSFAASFQPSKPIALLIPGIFGTKLASPTTTVWLSNGAVENINSLGALKYDVNGNPTTALTPFGSHADLFNLFENAGTSSSLTCTGGLLAVWDTLPGPSAQSRCQSYVYIYNSMRDALARDGYDPQTLPYDWRMDIAELSFLLRDAVMNLANLQPSRRIAIVAHSTGGLMVQELLRRDGPNMQAILGPIVTLGTPFNGSPSAYMKFQAWDSIAPFIGRIASQELGANWTSAYELLPRYDFLEFRGQVAHYKDLYAGLFFNTNIGPIFPALPRQNALPLAYSLWEQRLPVPAYSQAYAIIGSGMPTPAHLSDRIKSQCMTAEYGNGDQTVPIESAQATTWISQDHVRYIKEEHVLLPSNPAVIHAVLNVMANLQPDNLSANQYSQDPTFEAVACSPIDLSIANAANQQTNVNTRQILNGQYYNVGESTQIIVPSFAPGTTDQYTLELQGLGLGTFTLALREASAGIATSEVRFVDIPVSEHTKGSIVLQKITNGILLKLDIDGDGSADFLIQPNNQPSASSSIAVLSGILNTLQLDHGLLNSLQAKLNSAAASVQRGNSNAARGALNAFINEVDAQRGKSISSKTAGGLEQITATLLAML